MPRQYDLKKLSDVKHNHGSKALEMIMHDVIDGMEELANLAGYDPKPGALFEVLEIKPADTFDARTLDDHHAPQSENVVCIKKRRKINAA